MQYIFKLSIVREADIKKGAFDKYGVGYREKCAEVFCNAHRSLDVAMISQFDSGSKGEGFSVTPGRSHC